MASKKAPAFQFYIGDWIQDTRVLSLSAKGAWIDILCAMWRSQTRGALTLPLIGYSRLIGATVDQTKTVIAELVDLQICDFETDSENVTCNTNVIDCNTNVTLINRRMFREDKAKNKSRLRVAKYREKQQCNADVTPLSSVFSLQSSKSLSNDKPPAGVVSKHFSGKVGGYLKGIKNNCEQLRKLPQKKHIFNAYQWIQNGVNKQVHPGALDKTLQGLIKQWDSIKDPWAYAESIIKTLNGNFNEKDSVKMHEQFKAGWVELLSNEKLQGLVKGIG